MKEPVNIRTDTASRVNRSSPKNIYHAMLDPETVASWRAPDGMKCRIHEFEPCEGGIFRTTLGYADHDHPVRGKTSAHADVFHGHFLELKPDKRIVELIEFESDDPAYASPMKLVTTLRPVRGGTEVKILCEDVPIGIQPADHYKGSMSTLKNLAAITKGDGYSPAAHTSGV
jgi:uncharacterized protein YndB with AHSA1/START domain